MTDVAPVLALESSSAAPWPSSLRVERDGAALVCLLRAGVRPVGATAHARWRAGRIEATSAPASARREAALAEVAARRLSRAARADVACTAEIGFDSLDAQQAESLTQAVLELIRRVERELEDQRVAADLSNSRIAMRLGRSALARQPSVTEFLARPLAELATELRPQIEQARALYFRDQVRLFAPLYISNACLNDCAYCGFRRSASASRVHLSVDAALAEARALAAAGHRALDLVTGEVPHDAFIDQLCRIVEAVLSRTEIERIHLNLGALSLEQFRRLREAGAVGYHLYQETYDAAAYRAVHRSGPKRDMAHRLEAAERALAAGFEALGLGVLLGLAPLAHDLAALVEHARRLRELAPFVRLGFSLPRVQSVDAQCDYRVAQVVDDDDFAKAFLYLRREFPDADLTLTTRESSRLRDALLPLGVTKLSAGVCTAPG
ncbi:MAG: radical SAM protein, partial [Planctomycetes bacterium]|nr:radical SAM protein [Planctomycetota bacterium]